MPADEHFMERALALAAATAGLASPNPQVGCVLVRNGTVIGEGAHLYERRDHAEIVALKQAAARGLSPAGATAYVTLEPCSHHGRTPPCADALIAAGIARAVVATTDPNPLVSGQGIRKLRDAGIEVTLGICEAEARELNDAFAHFIQHRRPFVTLKAALSADGMLAPRPGHTPRPPAPLAHRPRRPRGGPAPPPRLRRHPHRHRHRPRRRPRPHRPQRHPRPRRPPPPPPPPPRRPRRPPPHPPHLPARPHRRRHSPGTPPDLLSSTPKTRPPKRSAPSKPQLPAASKWSVFPPPPPAASPSPPSSTSSPRRNCLSLLLECGSEPQRRLPHARPRRQGRPLLLPANPRPQCHPLRRRTPSPRSSSSTSSATSPARTLGPDTVVTGYLHHPWPATDHQELRTEN